MGQIVYGVFDDIERARAVAKEFAANTDEHPSFRTDIYKHAPFDGDQMPESATTAGGNLLIHIAIAAVSCLMLGAGAGIAGIIPGLSPGMGAALGGLFGCLAGGVNGMTAGGKSPKPELQELEAEVAKGKVLVLVDVDTGGHVKLVQKYFEAKGASIRGRC